MAKNYNRILLAITFIFITSIGLGQSNEIKVKFIGNCALYLTDGNTNLYIDFPYKSGAHKYMKYDPSELEGIQENSIFLFTHRHTDHYSKKLVNQVEEERNGTVYGNWNVDELEELNAMSEHLSIQAIKTPHKFTFDHYSYLITWHGKRIYISGDTGDTEEVGKLKELDWAFMNPWLYMNAQEGEIAIDAKMFGIYHLYPTQELPTEVPDTILFLKEQGVVLSIPY